MKSSKVFINSIYNLLGLGLPLFFAIFSIPLLIKGMGEANFGLLTLVWAVVSYFGLFDLGLGRALTQQLAIAIENDSKNIPSLISTSVLILTILGCLAGVLIFILAQWCVGLISAVPDEDIAVRSMQYMAIAMPAIVLTSGFRGILEATHSFGVINAIRIPMGVFTFCGPLIMVLFFSPRLDYITALLSFGRILACIVHAYFSWRQLPFKFNFLKLNSNAAISLCSSGGWITISNIISPLMGYADRFLIGFLVSATAVAYYTTPQEMITKIWIIPGAITAVIFPLFAAFSIEQSGKKKDLFINSIAVLYVLVLPISSLVYYFSGEILTMWLDKEFSKNSYILLMVFSFGIYFNCLAHIPYTYIQSINRAKLTALIHLFEFPSYMLVLWWATKSYGEVGAVSAWLIRILIDALLMFIVSMRLIDIRFKIRAIIPCIVFSCAFFVPPLFTSSTVAKGVIYFTVSVFFIMQNYKWIVAFIGNNKCSI